MNNNLLNILGIDNSFFKPLGPTYVDKPFDFNTILDDLATSCFQQTC